MALSPEEQILAYQAASEQVREWMTAQAQAIWSSLGSHRDADMERLVRLIVPRVIAGQVKVANLTVAYLAGLANVTPLPIGANTVALGLRGVSPDVVYQRPIRKVWAELAAGKSYADAKAAGLARLVSLIDTDMQLGMRMQEQAALKSGHYRFYRRVLTGTENCALCILASTQRYRVGALKAIHPGCDCTVAPLDAASDPGHILNDDLLGQIHESVGGNFKVNRSGREVTFADGTVRDYKDILIRQHGELGPTLTWRHQHFRGPSDVAA